MSPTSYRTAPPRDEECIVIYAASNVKHYYRLAPALHERCKHSTLLDTFSLNFLSRYAIATRMAPYLNILSTAILIVLCVFTFLRSAVYEDEVSLYTDIVTKSPNKARPHNNLGDAIKKAGRAQEAAPHFVRALELQPEYPDALNNLATIYNSSGQKQEALQLLSQALALNPGHLQARFNLAFSLYEQGLLSEAEEQFAILVQIAPYSKEGVFAPKMISLIRNQRKAP
jgi:tetratricopeptide (TPR) repeat protein